MRLLVCAVPEPGTGWTVRERPELGRRWAGPSVLAGSAPGLDSRPRSGTGSAGVISALFTWRPLFRVRARGPAEDLPSTQNSRPGTGKWRLVRARDEDSSPVVT